MLNIEEVKKDFRFSSTTIAHATHQPVLYTMCNKPNLRILEFGCGMFSTGLLSYLDSKLNHTILTFDNDNHWLDIVNKDLPYKLGSNHKLIYINDWNIFFAEDILKLKHQKYDVIFIDQAPWEARELTLSQLNQNSSYIIIHDSDFCPGYNIDYNKYLKFYKIFMPLEPYPYQSGPPTLLGSNYYNCNISIDYRDFI